MEFVARLVENRALARGSFVLRLAGCEALAGAVPGQFVMVRGAWGRDPLLPRAFSILRTRAGGECEILVKAVGRGTRLLEAAPAGASLHFLGPLGSRFAAPSGKWPGDVLVAGGVGVAPLLWYAEVERGARHHFLYGARSAADLVLLEEIRATGAQVTVTTEDGSSPDGGPQAIKGRVTEALATILAASAPGTRVLTCGPNPMMRAVVEQARAAALPCFISVEGEMACGIGACLGCAVPTDSSRTDISRAYQYACVDGPVFDANAIVIP
jgi:dihydroorotate dehydrogenase electron transfer subunit